MAWTDLFLLRIATRDRAAIAVLLQNEYRTPTRDAARCQKMSTGKGGQEVIQRLNVSEIHNLDAQSDLLLAVVK